jgi:hypothetical protein
MKPTCMLTSPGDLVDLPDVDPGCCYGSAVYGPHRCTCWKPVFDSEQVDVIPGKPGNRSTLCSDCAFRPNSPERNGDERFDHAGEGELEELVGGVGTFYCHQGMRRVVQMTHPCGAVVDIPPGSYHPPQRRGVAYKADGTPADVCAGLAARRKRLERK